MCNPFSSFSLRSRGSSSCGFAGSTATAARLIALLCVMTLAASGCARWAEPTAATGPAPLAPGAIVTDGWSYRYGGETFAESGEWVHLPAGEAGNLLLWIRSAEEGTR